MTDLFQNTLEIGLECTKATEIATVNIMRVLRRASNIWRQFIFTSHTIGKINNLQVDVEVLVPFVWDMTRQRTLLVARLMRIGIWYGVCWRLFPIVKD